MRSKTYIKMKTANSVQDAKLVKEFIKGNKRAFDALFKKYYEGVFNKCSIMTGGNKELSKDLAIEVFEKVFERIKQFNTSYAFSTWIYNVTKNHYLDYKRIKVNKFTVAFSKLQDEISNDREEPVIDFGSKDRNPEELAIGDEKMTQINKALNKLKKQEMRDAIRLRHFEGYSYEEIVDILKLPLSQIKSYICYGRKLMMAQIIR